MIHGMNSQPEAATAPPRARPAKSPDRGMVESGGEPMLLLLEAARRIECRVEDALGEVGLSIAKYQALDVLVTAGGPTRLGALAGSLDCVRSNVTQLADRLEGDGLIQREASRDDRRAVLAVLTPLGRQRHAAGAIAIRKLQAELAARVVPADRNAFYRMLSALC